MTNLVVTGGAGFLGSHFVRSLLAGRLPGLAGAQVTVLDKLTYAGNFANLGAVAHDKRLDFVPGDVTDPSVVEFVLRGADAVVHFAAETSAARSRHDPAAFTAANVLGTQILLDAALRHGIRRFLQISTDAVYGSLPDPANVPPPAAGPQIDAWGEDAPLNPTTPAAATKAAADLLALACHRTHGLPVLVARLCAVYGPHQHPEKTIPRFVTSLLSGRTLRLAGDGSVTRDRLHADDCSRAVTRILTDGRAGEVYHVGGSLELSERDLARLILAELHETWDRVAPALDESASGGHSPDRAGAGQPAPGRANAGPGESARDHRRALDDRRLRRELDWHPRVEFTTGLADTVAWYRANPNWWRPLLTI